MALATPPGTGAIAIVRISGPAVAALQARLLRTKTPLRPRAATLATILDQCGEPLDEGLAIAFPAPHSYTGEAMLELHLHGSPIVVRETIRAILACGARLAKPGEFTQRAFFNGKMDLHQAAAVAEIINAQTRSATRAALANLGGGLAQEVRAVRHSLAAIVEQLAGAIDFPDEVPDPNRGTLERALEPLIVQLERMRRDGERGRLVREGVSVAIVGPPNAGKSSLLNALVGMERAIVSEIPGTTRDTIEEGIVIDGVAVRLVDTAGIRTHADRLEAAGIERTHRALAAARIALVVIDASQPLDTDAGALLEQTRETERVVFFNKADLGVAAPRRASEAGIIVGSVRHETTLMELRRAIAAVGWGGERPDLSRPHLVALHEFEAINEALDALREARRPLHRDEPIDFVAAELLRAFSALGNVSEAVAAEQILDGVFSRFCIGK